MVNSPYVNFERSAWAKLRNSTPLTLTERDLTELQGINEQLSLDEVVAIYLPLSRLLNLYVAATQMLHQATDTFLGRPSARVPYLIGVAGSVAAGKSTTARLLQALLSRWPDHRQVDLVTTDGFLYPNAVLEARGLMNRKGFPESYDQRALLTFVAAVKSGQPEVTAPVYSHLSYDIVPGEFIKVRQPDIVIIEGLNVLQVGARLSVSDFFDFTIYVDAEESWLKSWYVERFLRLRETAFKDPASYFKHFAELPEAEAISIAKHIWDEINGRNLRENILPTRERATLILTKGDRHRIERVRLRKL
ncbi:MAG: type I pantothenate kinase [Truepera sp.]|nr:type I pantothenate kinase [Truepera sp.]